MAEASHVLWFSFKFLFALVFFSTFVFNSSASSAETDFSTTIMSGMDRVRQLFALQSE